MMHIIQPPADSLTLEKKGISKALPSIKKAKKLWLEIHGSKAKTLIASASTHLGERISADITSAQQSLALVV